MVILHRDRYQHKISIRFGVNLSVLRPVSVSGSSRKQKNNNAPSSDVFNCRAEKFSQNRSISYNVADTKPKRVRRVRCISEMIGKTRNVDILKFVSQ